MSKCPSAIIWSVLGQLEFLEARLIPGLATWRTCVYGCERGCRSMRKYFMEWNQFEHQIRGSGGTVLPVIAWLCGALFGMLAFRLCTRHSHK